MLFDVHDAAAVLGYLTLLVGFATLGSAGLARIQAFLTYRRHRDEPSRIRVRRVDPMHVSFDLGPDGTITDLVETDDDGHVVAEFHQPRPPIVAADWLPEDEDDDDRPACD